MNENPIQGSYIVEQFTDLVEEAVVLEFERIADRGGVLGAMETGYQRGRIQDESMLYEHRKHDESLSIIGVNTFPSVTGDHAQGTVELARGTEDEKASQLRRLQAFHERHRHEAPAALARLQNAATHDENVFDALMDAVRCCSLGQITDAMSEQSGPTKESQ